MWFLLVGSLPVFPVIGENGPDAKEKRACCALTAEKDPDLLRRCAPDLANWEIFSKASAHPARG
ncbi:hypothetical protein CKO11_01995 [Rhodobacter sp. TJ_12]|nr:hypothetical protein [Rhodobacter sp. TJ_12]